MEATLNINGIKHYNNLGYKAQSCFTQIINEGVIPKELMFKLIQENASMTAFSKNLRAAIVLLNNPRVMSYKQGDEIKAHIVNSKEKKCQILAVLFSGVKDNPDETVKLFDDLVSNEGLYELNAVNDFGINNAEMTRQTIHEIIRGLQPELFGQLQNPLVCIAQEAYEI